MCPWALSRSRLHVSLPENSLQTHNLIFQLAIFRRNPAFQQSELHVIRKEDCHTQQSGISHLLTTGSLSAGLQPKWTTLCFLLQEMYVLSTTVFLWQEYTCLLSCCHMNFFSAIIQLAKWGQASWSGVILKPIYLITLMRDWEKGEAEGHLGKCVCQHVCQLQALQLWLLHQTKKIKFTLGLKKTDYRYWRKKESNNKKEQQEEAEWDEVRPSVQYMKLEYGGHHKYQQATTCNYSNHGLQQNLFCQIYYYSWKQFSIALITDYRAELSWKGTVE